MAVLPKAIYMFNEYRNFKPVEIIIRREIRKKRGT
jgi:hypothetical protein